MSTTITIRDESTTGKTLKELSIEVLTEHLTVRELIRSRVYQEVQDFNMRPTEQQEAFTGLIQPTETEVALNGECDRRKRRQIDWHRQFDRAIEAIESNRILILVNDRQVETLDEEIAVGPSTQISFLRLTMLKGG